MRVTLLKPRGRPGSKPLTSASALIPGGHGGIGYYELEAVVNRVQEITEQLRSLSGAELRELRAWLDDYEDRAWDEQFEAEVAAGKWDALAEKALRDHKEGNSTAL